MYKAIQDTTIIVRIADGAHIPSDPGNADWLAYQIWVAAGNTPQSADTEPTPTQHDLDYRRYIRRASVRDRLLAEMAADNMARVRSGTWTVADLTNLMSDPVLKSVLELVGTLSYELAAQLLATSTHPLLTPEIRAGWVAKLQSHFYLVP